MILDDKLLFSDAQEITTSAASAFTINWGEVNPNLGKGSPLVIRFVIEQTFSNGTSLQISLQHGSGSTPSTDLVNLPLILTASLTQGAYIPEIKIPDEHLQYMRLYYTVDGAMNAGKITAYINLDR